MPVFAVLFSPKSGSLRQVRKGWVERSSDRELSFLIGFGVSPTPEGLAPDADAMPAQDPDERFSSLR